MIASENGFVLTAGTRELQFRKVNIVFDTDDTTIAPFTLKNNRTLRETLNHRRYKSLALEVASRYATELTTPLGSFLASLIDSDEAMLRKFLNPYGAGPFCRFRITEPDILAAKGLYAFTVDQTLVYIGRCRDNFGKRINQGYGIVHPKNCYLDGQSTNCHLNALIANQRGRIGFAVCVMQSNSEIEESELMFLKSCELPWNIQIAAKTRIQSTA